MWNIEFYETEGGSLPVRDFIESLSDKHQAKIVHRIDLLAETGNTLKEPHVKKLEGKIWELRVQASPNIYRILYFTDIGKDIVLLHGFTKKTQKTPRKEIEIATERMKDYQRRNKNG